MTKGSGICWEMYLGFCVIEGMNVFIIFLYELDTGMLAFLPLPCGSSNVFPKNNVFLFSALFDCNLSQKKSICSSVKEE